MFECKIANIDELTQKWDYEIALHPNDNRWVIWKDVAIKNSIDGNRIVFIGMLYGEIIAECTAIVSKNDSGLENKEFVSKDCAYLEAFRVIKEFRGMGYFSKLYRFMESYLFEKGFKKFILGVEPTETRNMQIYLHYGFDKLIKTKMEAYPPEREGDTPEEYLVNYYMKEL